MKFYKPQVQLVRRSIMDEPDQYFLHAVTFCPRTSFRADGHAPVAEAIAENGVLPVDLYIQQDAALPDFEYITPVVHTVELGSLPFEEEDGVIAVNVFVKKNDQVLERTAPPTDPDDPDATSTVSPTEADEDDRPMGGG